MKELVDKLRRDVRRLRDDVAPFCSDDGINTLMDIHDELLRTVRKIESAMRAAEATEQSANAVESQPKRAARATSAP